MKVACIGLGQMGGPMADHVIAAGFDVAVVDLNEELVARRVANGARAAATPADAADGADVISITVFSDAQLIDVVCGPNGILQNAKDGAVIAVHTTALVKTIRDLAEQASSKNVHVVDAGISGGESGAVAGTLLLLVGGELDDVEKVRPVLSTFAKEVVSPVRSVPAWPSNWPAMQLDTPGCFRFMKQWNSRYALELNPNSFVMPSNKQPLLTKHSCH